MQVETHTEQKLNEEDDEICRKLALITIIFLTFR